MATTLAEVFDQADRLTTLPGLAEALTAQHLSGLVTRDLSDLLARAVPGRALRRA